MKKPRVEDFDPNDAPALGSPLDEMPAIQSPVRTQPLVKRAAQAPVVPLKASMNEQPPVTTTPAPVTTTELAPATDIEGPTARPSGRTPVRPTGSTPGRRAITRCAFEFFQDQIETLRGFSLEEKLRGEKGSMSEMVREAVDMYIARRNRTEGE